MSSIIPREGWGYNDNHIGKYVREEEIGRGTFATVYRGFHLKTYEQVAIKVIMKAKLQGKLITNIESEIDILKKMKHPNIVTLLDIERTETKICLVMELCSFGDLSEYIKNGKTQPGTKGPAGGLSEIIFRHFLKQLASSFQFLRKHNLVHRDLKPQNILLSPPKEELFSHSSTEASNIANSLPRLKVGDFGFAKILPTQSLTDTVCGSPLYMAPEVLQNYRYDATADLWSIGAVLYEMITGRPPFTAKGHADLIRVIKNNRDNIVFPGEKPSGSFQNQDFSDLVIASPNRNSLISSDIKDLIRSLLIQSPSNRISFESFFSHPAIMRDITDPLPQVPSRPTPQFSIRRTTNIPEHNTYWSKNIDDSESSKLKKSSSLSSLKGRSIFSLRNDERTDQPSNLSNALKDNGYFNNINSTKDKEEDSFDNDYVLIEAEKELRNLDLNKKDAHRRMHSISSFGSVPNSNMNNHTSLRGLPIPNSLPKGLLGEDNSDFQSKDISTNTIQKTDYQSEQAGPENGWTVGSNAASTLAKAITHVSLKLFGVKGLSPPAVQYRSDSSDPTSFPLSGPSTDEKEKAVLRELEQIACQVYALSKFADTKLDKIHSLNEEPLSESKESSDKSLVEPTQLLQEAFLIYSKTLALLQKAIDAARAYWMDISKSHNVVVSARLSKAARWLQDKFNECLEKAEFAQSHISDIPSDNRLYDVDSIIYHHALDICRDAAVKELVADDIQGSEPIYKMGLWMLQALMIRTSHDSSLSGEDIANIRLMMNKVEGRLDSFRKRLELAELRPSGTVYPA